MLRSDYRANMLAVARAIGWAADWDTLRSRPTMAAIVERTGLALRTVQRWCRWLEHRGLIEVLQPGVTPRYLASRSQRLAAERARELAEQTRRRAERRTPAGQVAAEGAARARELLAARLGQAPARWWPPGIPSASR